MNSKYIELPDNLRLHYLERTTRNPDYTLLFLHGLSSSSYLWVPLVKEFESDIADIYCLDLRGHGLTDKPEGNYYLETLANDVLNFIKKKNLKNIIMIGQSMGGDLGVSICQKVNERIVGCIGIDGGAINLKENFESKKVALEKLRPPDLDGMDKDVMLTRLRKNWPDWSEDAIMGQFSIFSVNKDNKITKRLSLINHLKILESLWENDSISNLKNIKVPLLLILVKYNTDLTFIKDSNVRIDIERVNGDHDIHAQKPKLVHKIIEKRINGKFFEK